MPNFSRPFLILSLLLLLVLAACAPPDLSETAAQPVDTSPVAAATTEPAGEAAVEPTSEPETLQRGQGMGGHGNMMRFHHAQIPEDYAGLSNPVAVDDESLARGQVQYQALCASCHGDSGMGEGPAGQVLDPPASPIARTSQMMTDGYLFWRVTEGGVPFDTAMPAWGDALDEDARWDVINYTRSLATGGRMGRGPGGGQGQGQGQGMAGMNEEEHHAEMLAEGIEMGLFTEADAELFLAVHAVLDEYYRTGESNMDEMPTAGKQSMQRAMTGQAVRDGYITQEQADRFTEIHDVLLEAGIM